MNTAFLIFRVVHVLMAALWLGSVVFLSMFLMPVIQQIGPVGGQVMVALVRRKLVVFMAIIGGTTVITGLWLYWRFTSGFDPGLSGSTAGMMFGTGGVCGIIAAIIGGSVVGRGSGQLVELAEKVESLPDGPERAAALQAIPAIRKRIGTASKILILLLVTALTLMTLGHYV